MTRVVVGVDAGGTKCAVRVETLDGARLADTVFAADGWEAEPVEKAASWLKERVDRAVGREHDVAAIGVGAQGCDTLEVGRALGERLSLLGAPAIVVNDAALLVPAAGYSDGIGVIAGTGSIAVGSSADGAPLFAGGWGWVIGDDAGAPAIVREAAKAALWEHDRGETDDGLLAALLDAFGVSTAERLARAVNDDPTVSNWGPHARAVFDADAAGSRLASGVIEHAAEHLAALVDQLVARGAAGSAIVTAGSVIAGQPHLAESFTEILAERHPGTSVTPLTDQPVAGGIVLAKRLLATR